MPVGLCRGAESPHQLDFQSRCLFLKLRYIFGKESLFRDQLRPPSSPSLPLSVNYLVPATEPLPDLDKIWYKGFYKTFSR